MAHSDREEAFKIYIDRLKGGASEDLEERFSPHFLDVNEEELKFTRDVAIQGEAYLADDTLLIQLDIYTAATIPCIICNTPVEVDMEIRGSCSGIPLPDIKGATYNFRELLRQVILLEVPSFAECHHGHCPQRREISKYLKREPAPCQSNGSEGDYHPFENVDFDQFNFKS